jgi:hypothetical protein
MSVSERTQSIDHRGRQVRLRKIEVDAGFLDREPRKAIGFRSEQGA